MKRRWLTVLTLMGALLYCGRAMAQCVDMTDDPLSYDPSDEHRAFIAKKIEYALAVISDEQQSQKDPDCLATALFFLGRFHAEKAIPRMLALLTFEQQPDRFSAQTRAQRYPAVAGLAGIGKPAVPALMSVIADSQIELERDNALWALTIIYVGHPKQVIQMLHKAADAERDYGKASNYREAANKVPPIACRDKDASRCDE